MLAHTLIQLEVNILSDQLSFMGRAATLLHFAKVTDCSLRRREKIMYIAVVKKTDMETTTNTHTD